jgi:hypothetical protein
MSGRIAASIGWLPFPIAVARSDPEQTFDAANGAADHPADNPPDRARRVVSDIRAMGGAFRNALRLRRALRPRRLLTRCKASRYNPLLCVENYVLRRRHVAANEGVSAALRRGIGAIR